MVTLNSQSGSLTLCPDEAGADAWCQVSLIADGVSRPLGADRLSEIALRLAAFLVDASPGLRWVFSLSKRHHSAYGEHRGNETVLRVQDAHGIWIGDLVLTGSEKQNWIEALSLLTKSPRAGGAPI